MQAQGSVARRRVFYIPGYDPFHPRRYRELYRTESAEQARLRGYEIAVSARPGARYGWNAETTMEGTRTHAEVEVLVWSDIVKDSMEAGILATYGQLIRTAAIYIGSGALFRLMRLRIGPVIAALYPVGMLLLQLALALLVARIAGGVVAWGAGLAGLSGLPVTLLAWGLGLAATIPVFRWFRKQDKRFYAYYLMHDYAFSARWLGENPPALEVRMAEFADAVAEALSGDADEVLVVGHSSGAHLAVSVLADLLRQGRVPEDGPVLSFLSLGQVIPMVSFLPKASRLRADLHLLCQSDRISWVDVTAPGDGCAFALCDPVAVSGVRPESGQRGPLILSAAFTQTLLPETWKRLKRRYFRLHFQYLCAFDNLPDSSGAYDYFAVTAGPRTLAHRFAARKPSKSRIDVAASGYTTIAP
ncbi:hypothetical protein FEV53_17055 [Palleronia caenipelagi]|uniref:Alpha/beta hydrolase n=1 Tax=Palleronia caenipelagi TaxID=2489174 RepID=A0A547PME0_9RHOB|nr:hypothetical protein FEV53_17055 [Palleronia caenipelagi]